MNADHSPPNPSWAAGSYKQVNHRLILPLDLRDIAWYLTAALCKAMGQADRELAQNHAIG